MKKALIILVGVIILLFVAYPFLNGNLVAVFALAATFGVLGLCFFNSLYAFVTGKKKPAGFIKSTFRKRDS